MGGPRLVQWSRFSDAWQRLFGVQGATALNVIDDVFLTLPSEEEQLHLAYLRGWVAWGYDSQSAAAVGNFSAVGFNNPANSGRLVVVQGLYAQSVGSLSVTNGPRVFGTAAPVFARDSRVIGLGFGAGRIPGVEGGTDNAHAAPWVTFRTMSVPANTQLPVPLVVAPGQALVFEGEAPNTAVRASLWGLAREITPQEH